MIGFGYWLQAGIETKNHDKLILSLSNIIPKGGAVLTTFAQGLFNSGLRDGLEKGLEKGRKEGLEKGREEGLETGQLQMVKNMLNKGLSIENIAEYTGVALSKIHRFLQSEQKR